VSGGQGNEANAYASSVTGGVHNTADDPGHYNTVSGRENNLADRDYSSISGGSDNTAQGVGSSISGGKNNLIGTSGDRASVSGGSTRSVNGQYDWRGGSYFSTN
jgi:hypothetical protein